MSMKIESFMCYDSFDNFISFPHSEVFGREYQSLHEMAVSLRDFITHHDTCFRIIAFVDNFRYLYVTYSGYDVHYHSYFNV